VNGAQKRGDLTTEAKEKGRDLVRSFHRGQPDEGAQKDGGIWLGGPLQEQLKYQNLMPPPSVKGVPRLGGGRIGTYRGSLLREESTKWCYSDNERFKVLGMGVGLAGLGSGVV